MDAHTTGTQGTDTFGRALIGAMILNCSVNASLLGIGLILAHAGGQTSLGFLLTRWAITFFVPIAVIIGIAALIGASVGTGKGRGAFAQAMKVHWGMRRILMLITAVPVLVVGLFGFFDGLPVPAAYCGYALLVAVCEFRDPPWLRQALTGVTALALGTAALVFLWQLNAALTDCPDGCDAPGAAYAFVLLLMALGWAGLLTVSLVVEWWAAGRRAQQRDLDAQELYVWQQHRRRQQAAAGRNQDPPQGAPRA